METRTSGSKERAGETTVRDGQHRTPVRLFGLSLLPVVRWTWAPRGKTRVIRHHLNNRKRLSRSAAVCIAPDYQDAALVFGMHPGSYNDEALIEFLEALHDHLGGDKVTLVWDGLVSPHSRERSWV